MANSRPNLLLIHSDQHRFDCLGIHASGNGPRIRTPNLDRLAAQGADFVNAFTPSPICSPARASLLTGRWPSQHRCQNIPPFDGYRPAETGEPILWQRLGSAGYRMAHFGKFHGEVPGDPTGYGVERYAWEEDDYDAWRAQRGLPPRERTNGWFGEVDRTSGVEDTRIAWGAGLTCDAIRDFSADNTDGSRPFFVRWDPSEPHLPCLVPEAVADDYPAGSIPPWPAFADPLEDKPPMQAQQRRSWGVDGWGWEQWAPVVSRYLAEITLLDAKIGEVLDALDTAGVAENTLVVYSTDHGDLCGSHGMMDKHYMMYDDVLKVPLVARFPGRIEPGSVRDDFVVHELDLHATLLSAAGVGVPDHAEGLDLLAGATGREDVFSQYFGCQFGQYSTRMVRDRRWKYVWNLTAVDELYDLQTDPIEFVNRVHDPAAAGELARLRQRTLHWCETLDDRICNGFTRLQLEDPAVTAAPGA
ncbi:sulfatase-like hydrolase/transferase [Phycisphaera mikurensis]|uniref:Sulfatase n=1 Tax=Phycisphaera mikurensis (strain NBRC 102666 / KCTC 22515 / FYK2301M01) TaxID=1142394 RepID=I0IBK6_PHYMF|nr:sulfatase-like hydrolase/transferase [Phycisphaera mikurensis]MBB6442826.1 arylsulfatase A-like enzyme [Phycisphaera mikurensis]BAM02644.1 sulfatase [Phycisphaera mikurensis NBRC 102666]